MSKIKINPSLAIGAVIQNKRGKILLVQEQRNKSYEKAKGVWGLPAGKVAWTEPILKGLKRELREELNIDVKPIGLIDVYQYLRDSSQCLGLAFEVELKSREEDINYKKDEIAAIKWFNIESIINSKTPLRFGVKEVLNDYREKRMLLPKYIHFFNLFTNN